MDRGGILVGLVAVSLVGLAVAVVTAPPWLLDDPTPSACEDIETDHGINTTGDRYDRTTVTLWTTNGTRLGAVDVRIADTDDKRYTGLSNTSSLASDEGMLFVHPSDRSYTYVMREMNFPIDIVFVDSDGEITTIHHASVPEEIPGGNGRFPGEGKYVLEVDRGWTNESAVATGDCVAIPENVTAN